MWRGSRLGSVPREARSRLVVAVPGDVCAVGGDRRGDDARGGGCRCDVEHGDRGAAMTAVVASSVLSAPQRSRRLVTGDGMLGLRQRTLRSQESASTIKASGKTRPVRLSVSVHHPACGAHWTGARTAHCACCHLTTSGIHAFDAHQRITGGVLHCLLPDVAGLVPSSRPWGVLWTLPVQDSAPWIAGDSEYRREDRS